MAARLARIVRALRIAPRAVVNGVVQVATLARIACRASRVGFARCGPAALVLALGGMKTAASVPDEDVASLRWRAEAIGRGGERGAVTALARDAAGGRIAVGDQRHAVVHRAGEATTWLARGPVHALAFLADGALLVGLEDGLLRCDAPFACRDATPAPGSAARQIHALASAPGLVAVATEDGAFVSSDGRTWGPVRGPVPAGAVRSLALRPSPEAVVLWLVVRDGLWRVAVERNGGALASLDARSTRVLGGEIGELVRVELDAAGRAVAIGERALAREREDGGFETLRPALPAGALPSCAAFGARAWIGTDRGLVVASSLDAPFARIAAAPGTEPVLALLLDGESVLAGTEQGAYRIAPLRDVAHEALDATPPDPPVREVMRAAMRWLDLGPGRMRRLREGVDRRGLWPELSLGVSHDTGKGSSHTSDQSFVSGDVRHLFDRDHSRDSELRASVVLQWELGDLDFHPDALDVSKEAREVIELRDDVMDEITQLYFERRRVLAERAALPPERAAERAPLALRAEELAAGLDAWTGGWFSRHAAPLGP